MNGCSERYSDPNMRSIPGSMFRLHSTSSSTVSSWSNVLVVDAYWSGIDAYIGQVCFDGYCAAGAKALRYDREKCRSLRASHTDLGSVDVTRRDWNSMRAEPP